MGLLCSARYSFTRVGTITFRIQLFSSGEIVRPGAVFRASGILTIFAAVAIVHPTAATDWGSTASRGRFAWGDSDAVCNASATSATTRTMAPTT